MLNKLKKSNLFAIIIVLAFMPLLPFCYADEPLLDLDALVGLVSEEKQIIIPGYPHAFNASIVRWNDSLLMSFRFIPDPKSSFTCYLGIVWLDEEFNVIGIPQILDFRGQRITSPSRSEDGRLIIVNGCLFIIYDDNVDQVISRGGFRVFMAELVLDEFSKEVTDELNSRKKPNLAVKNIECLSKFDGESQNRREKGWVPFNYQGNLLLSYSINPHKVFYPVFGSNGCETIAYSESLIDWPYGELRGGTPAIQINDSSYLSFFHSSIPLQSLQSRGQMVTHYFIGAYLFEVNPPFAMTHVSCRPIIGKNFYNGPYYKPYWKPILAVFPCGIIINDSDVWISYGRDDHEIWVAKINKESLLNSLVPCGH